MDTKGRCDNKDKREEKPETQVEDPKTSTSALAPENVTSDSRTVNEEEVCCNTMQDLKLKLTKFKQEQRKRNERYMALLKEEQAWKETLSILQSAEPLRAGNIGRIMKMRQNMKGALVRAQLHLTSLLLT